MNLHIPDVRTLEVHLTPWSTQQDTCHTPSLLEEREELGLPLLLHAVEDAAKLGYNFLNVCGAAAVNYPGLPALCRAAHRNGMLTSTVAGSGRLAAAQLDWLRFSIDLLGVEMEGGPRARQRRRCMPRAQQAISERLKAVRAAGIPFAMVFPLSAKTIANLEWAASTAVSEGAAMLQVRPAPEMSPEEMAEAWDETERVCELERGNLVIHIDTVNPCNLPAEPPDLAAWKQAVEAGARHLGEIITPLVIEPEGWVLPLRSGFPRRFAFGNLHRERLMAMARGWLASEAGAFCCIYGTVLREERSGGRMFTDLLRTLAMEAGRAGMGEPAA